MFFSVWLAMWCLKIGTFVLIRVLLTYWLDNKGKVNSKGHLLNTNSAFYLLSTKCSSAYFGSAGRGGQGTRVSAFGRAHVPAMSHWPRDNLARNLQAHARSEQTSRLHAAQRNAVATIDGFR